MLKFQTMNYLFLIEVMFYDKHEFLRYCFMVNRDCVCVCVCVLYKIAVNPKRYTGIDRYPKYTVQVAKPIRPPVRY